MKKMLFTLFIIFFFILSVFNINSVTDNTANLYENTTDAITIDGSPYETAWAYTRWTEIKKVSDGSLYQFGSDDLRAFFKVLYDSANLYIAVKVNDSIKNYNGNINEYVIYDSIDLFFDMANHKSSYLQNDDFQYAFLFNKSVIYAKQGGLDTSSDGILFQWSETYTGYVLEAKIPAECLGLTAITAEKIFGFDVLVNDNDNKVTRDCQIAYSGGSNDYTTTSLYGELISIQSKEYYLIEAEGSAYQNMGLYTTKGTTYLETISSESGKATFDFSTFKKGMYCFWVKVSGKSSLSNEFYYYFDNNTSYKKAVRFNADSQFNWVKLDGSDFVVYEALAHTITLAGKDKQVKFEKVILTNSNTDVPSIPITLKLKEVNYTTGNCQLNWEGTDDLVEKYSIERSVDSSSFTVIHEINDNSIKSYTDNTIPATGRVAYRVTAHSFYDKGISSNVVYCYPANPKPVSTLNAIRYSTSQYKLTWPEVVDITSYSVERKTGNGDYALITGTPTVQNAIYTLYNSIPDSTKNYQYRIKTLSGSLSSEYCYAYSNDDAVKDIAFSHQKSGFYLEAIPKNIDVSTTVVKLYNDISDSVNRFNFLPAYLKGSTYLRGFFNDYTLDDANYLSMQANASIYVYLLLPQGADIESDEWMLKESAVMINNTAFPNGVDIYYKTFKYNERINLAGNRNYTHSGYQYLVFIQADKSLYAGIKFIIPGTTPPPDMPDGFMTDSGAVIPTGAALLQYGWQTQLTSAAGGTEANENNPLFKPYIKIPQNNEWKINLPYGIYKVKLALFSETTEATSNRRYKITINGKAYNFLEDIYADPGQTEGSSEQINNNKHLFLEDIVKVDEASGSFIRIKKTESNVLRLYYLQIEYIAYQAVNTYKPLADTFIHDNSGTNPDNREKSYIAIKNADHPMLGLIYYQVHNYEEINSAFVHFYLKNASIAPAFLGKSYVFNLYALKGFSFNESTPEITWQNSNIAGNDGNGNYHFIGSPDFVAQTVISTVREGYYSFNIKDYLLNNRQLDNITFIVTVEGNRESAEELTIMSKDFLANPPYIEINTRKEMVEKSGLLTKINDDYYQIQSFEDVEYDLSSDFISLASYVNATVKITGYINPYQLAKNGVKNKIKVEAIEKIAPEKVIAYTDYWNNNGLPQWIWVAGIGANHYRYKMDNTSWVETNDYQYTPAMPLSEGLHTLTVQCTNSSITPYLWSEECTSEVKVDYTKPTVTIIPLPTPIINFKPSITWTAGDNYTVMEELIYYVAIDSLTEWHTTLNESYTPPLPLAKGNHIFNIKAKDLAQNVSIVYQYNFTIGSNPPGRPKIMVINPTNNVRPAISWDSTDDVTPKNELTYLYSFNNGPFTATLLKSFTPDYNLATGFYPFKVKALDGENNESPLATENLYVDLINPQVTNVQYQSPTNAIVQTFIRDLSDDYQNNVSENPKPYMSYYAIDSTALTNSTIGNTCIIDTSLSEGEHIFRIQVRDPAGNASAVEDYLLLIDRSKPEVLSLNYYIDENNRYYFEANGSDNISIPNKLRYSFMLNNTVWTEPTTDNRFYLAAMPLRRSAKIFNPLTRSQRISDLYSSLKVKLYDEADNTSDVTESTGSKSKKIICTELYRQGLMDKITYEADQKFGEMLAMKHPAIMEGYHFLAQPLVKGMKKSKTFTRVVNHIANPWAKEMAYEMGYRSQGDALGKVLMVTGSMLCWVAGMLLLHGKMVLGIVLGLLLIILGRRNMGKIGRLKRISFFMILLLWGNMGLKGEEALSDSLLRYEASFYSNPGELKWIPIKEHETIPPVLLSNMIDPVNGVLMSGNLLSENLRKYNELTDAEREYYFPDSGEVLYNAIDEFITLHRVKLSGDAFARAYRDSWIPTYPRAYFKSHHLLKVTLNTSNFSHRYEEEKEWIEKHKISYGWIWEGTKCYWEQRDISESKVPVSDFSHYISTGDKSSNKAYPIITNKIFLQYPDPESMVEIEDRAWFDHELPRTEIYWDDLAKEFYMFRAKSPCPKLNSVGARYFAPKVPPHDSTDPDNVRCMREFDISFSPESYGMLGIKALAIHFYRIENGQYILLSNKKILATMKEGTQDLKNVKVNKDFFDTTFSNGLYCMFAGVVDKFNKIYLFEVQQFIIDNKKPSVQAKPGKPVINPHSIINKQDGEPILMEWQDITDDATNLSNNLEEQGNAIYIKAKGMNDAKNIKEVSFAAFDKDNKQIKFTREDKYFIDELYVMDRAGNKKMLIDSQKYYLWDNTNPSIRLSPQDNGDKLYRKNDIIKAYLYDNLGIGSVTVTHKKTVDIDFTPIKFHYLPSPYNEESMVLVELKELQDLVTDFTLQIKVTDEAGNVTTTPYTFHYDNKVPQVTAKIDGAVISPYSIKNLNGEHTLTVEATDEHFNRIELYFDSTEAAREKNKGYDTASASYPLKSLAGEGIEKILLTIKAYDNADNFIILENINLNLYSDNKAPTITYYQNSINSYWVVAEDANLVEKIYYKTIDLPANNIAEPADFEPLPQENNNNNWQVINSAQTSVARDFYVYNRKAFALMAEDSFKNRSNMKIFINTTPNALTINNKTDLAAQGWNLHGNVTISGELTIESEEILTISANSGIPTVINFNSDTSPLKLINNGGTIIIDSSNEEISLISTSAINLEYKWFGIQNISGNLQFTGSHNVYFKDAEAGLSYYNASQDMTLYHLNFYHCFTGIHFIDGGSQFNRIHVENGSFDSLTYGVKLDFTDGYANVASYQQDYPENQYPVSANNVNIVNITKGFIYCPYKGIVKSINGLNNAPYLTDLKIKAYTEPKTGHDLKAEYNYFDIENHSEDKSKHGTLYQWYQSATATGQYDKITDATKDTWHIVAGFNNKWIKVKVIPKDSNGGLGSAYYSNPAQIDNRQPYVEGNITITGLLNIGETVTGIYEYKDPDGDPQGASIYRWEKSATADFTQYNVVMDNGQPWSQNWWKVGPVEDAGQYIRFMVKPVDANGLAGNEYRSTGYLINPFLMPEITKMEVKGQYIKGNTIEVTVSINYHGGIDAGSTATWYRADDANGTNESPLPAEDLENNKTARYVINDDLLVIKYLYCKISPKSTFGTGLTQSSLPQKVLTKAPSVKVTGIGGIPNYPTPNNRLEPVYDFIPDEPGAVHGEDLERTKYQWFKGETKDDKNFSAITDLTNAAKYCELKAEYIGKWLKVMIVGVNKAGVESEPAYTLTPVQIYNLHGINPRIEGRPRPGSKLTAKYDFKDIEGSYENNPKYQWYQASNAEGPYVPIKEGEELIYDTSYNGKWLRFEVTPRNDKGIEGDILTSKAIVRRLKEFKAVGETNWQPDAIVTNIKSDLILIGGGGGGGGGSSGYGIYLGGGGGGGGAGQKLIFMDISLPNTLWKIKIGRGGPKGGGGDHPKGSGHSASDGDITTFTTVGISYTALNGKGAKAPSSPEQPGTGGWGYNSGANGSNLGNGVGGNGGINGHLGNFIPYGGQNGKGRDGYSFDVKQNSGYGGGGGKGMGPHNDGGNGGNGDDGYILIDWYGYEQ